MPRVGVVEAHDAFDQRRLAGAVLAEQRVERAGLDLDRHVVERDEAARRSWSCRRLRATGARSGCVAGDRCRRRSWQRLEEALRGRHRAEHAALHLDHVERGEMVLDLGRRAAIRQQQALVAAVVGVAHRGVHADVGGDAGEDDVADALRLQHQFEVGGEERALARLVDDRPRPAPAAARG